MPTSFQRSFAGGIITQPNLNRKDTAKVASGLADALNGWLLPGGAFQNRPGLRTVTTTKDQAAHVRIRRFFFNDAQAYALEFGEFYIRLYQLSAQAYANATIIPPDPFVVALVDIYPDDAADDLAALSGTLPSVGPISTSELLLSLRLKQTADGTTTQTFGGGPGARTGCHVYSSLTGFPGGIQYWTDDTLTMRVKITSLTPSNGGTLDAGAGDFAFLLPRLHRTTSGGAGQERISAGGVALGDPTSCTIPGGGAGALSGTGVDIIAGGLGTYIFTWSGAGHWGNSGAAIATTDRISAEVIASWQDNNGGVSVIQYDIESTNTRLQFLQAAPNQPGVPWNPLTEYVPGDVVFTGTGPLVYYYCVARHTNKNPDTVIYQNDFWYLLPNAASGDPILEIPTPYTAADVPDVVASLKQSGDTITITHHNYPPHELIRHLDEVYSFGRWSFLPIGFKPRTVAPTGITLTDSGTGGDKTIRYKITAIDRDTGAESAAGQYTTTDTGAVPGDPTVALENPTDATNSITQDVLVNNVAHGLVDGTEIYISLVAPTSTDRANENARIALEGTTWTIAKVDTDSFRLNGTAGLLTRPVISSVVEGYPTFNITYALAYAELVGIKIPRSSGGSRVALEWDEVPNAKNYFVYRTVLGFENWGFLSSTAELTYADEGDQEAAPAAVAAVVDTDSAPPDYRSPFRYGTWPRANAYHMQRQWFGGTVNYPLRSWGSVTGDFRNFSTRTPIVASDSLDFTINSEDANEIQSMATMGVLLIFTTGVVWKLPGNLDGVIAADEPPNLQTVTYEGASGVGPLVVGDSALFLRAPGRSAIKALRIDAGDRGATAQSALDLTLYAPELFKGYTIVDLARMSIPNNLVFAVRSDGQALCLTYVMEQEVWAWARMETRVATDAFQSVCCIPEEGADALYAIVRRDIDGTDTWFVERMDQRRLGEADVDDRLAMYFVDAGLTFDGTNDTATTLALSPPGSPTWLAGATGYTLTASAALFVSGDVDNGYRLVAADGTTEAEVIVTAFTSATVVTVKLLTDVAVSLRSTARATWVAMVDDVSGLDHLDGETVAVFADGYRLGTALVTAGAIPKLVKFAGLLAGSNFPSNRPYGIIHVGLPIEVSFEATPIDSGDESAISSALKRVGQAALWLNRSYRPTAGPVGGNLFALTPQHGDVETTLITGPRVATIEGTFNREGRVKVRQADPVPLEVTALMLEYEVGGL